MMHVLHRLVALTAFLMVATAFVSTAAAENIALVTNVGGLKSVERVDPLTGQSQVIAGPVAMAGHQWSHDGTRLAYLAEAEGTGVVSLHVVDVVLATDTIVSGAAHVIVMQWTSDGQRLGFATYQPRANAGQLYLASSTGGTPVAVSGDLNPGLNVDFSFSPDGRYLAFGVPDPRRDDHRVLAITDLTTQQPVEVPGINALRWAWSPTQPTLAVLGTPNGEIQPKLYGVGVDGSAPVLLSPVPEGVLAFEWSPNGRHLVYRIAPIEGAARAFIVDTALNHMQMVQGTSNVVNFVWSPDGWSFAVKDGDPEAPRPLEHLRIGTLTEPITGETWLVSDSLGVTRLAWSRAGDQVAYLKDYEVFVADVATREARSVHNVLKIEAVTWRPDGKQLLAVAGHPKERALILVLLTLNDEGPATHELISGAFKCPLTPDWSPDGQRIMAFAHLSAEEALVLVFDPANPTAEIKVTDRAASGSWYPRPW